MEKICRNLAVSSCNHCGRLVCSEHYHQRTGLCSHCIPPTDRRNSDHRKGERPQLME
ncbi:MAG TPA: hypothetical protein VLU38_07210 [Methanomassiliicoccales archaeon]|nr:hypothetical protein [Methanomassiliicoccales archaeon]